MNEEKDAITCPYCNSEDFVKNGIIGTRQRYFCKNMECAKNFYIKETPVKMAIRRRAVIMYLEGLDYETISKKLEVPRYTVSGWIRHCNYDFLKKIRNPIKSSGAPGIYTVMENKDKSYTPTRLSNGFLVIEREEKTYIGLLGSKMEVPYRVRVAIPKKD